MDPEIARHLVAADDSTLVAFCREVGWSRVNFARTVLSARDFHNYAEFKRLDKVSLPYLRRIASAVGIAFNMPDYSVSSLRTFGLPVETRFRREVLLKAIVETASDPTLSSEEKTSRLLRILDECRADLEPLRVSALDYLAATQLAAGDKARFLYYSHGALDAARAGGNIFMSCTLLGGIGEALRQSGEADSMAYYWRLGLDLAERHSLTDQRARLHRFFGNYYADLGRWAVASEYLREARRFALAPTSYGDGTRQLLEALEFPARLGCWDLVARELRSVSTGIREARAAASPFLPFAETRYLELRARDAAHRGDLTSADHLFAEADRIYLRVGGRIPSRASLLSRWSLALTEGGLSARAATIAQRGLEYCEAVGISEHVPANSLALARASFDQGDLESCESALDRFRHVATARAHRHPKDWVMYDALRVRWHRTRGDRTGMIAALRDGLARLESSLVAMDARPETYFVLLGRNDLRELMHQLVAASPEVGYAIERQWRCGRSLIRANAPTGDLTMCADLVAAHLEPPLQPAVAAAPADTSRLKGTATEIRVLYHVGEHVVRWTVTAGGVRRDELPVPPRDLERMTSDVIARMSSAPRTSDAGLDDTLRADLANLGQLLLPVEITTASSAAGRVSVTPDGFLDRLPFEALSLSTREYRPLLEDWDVVYVRASERMRNAPTAGPGTIVGDPALSVRMKLRHGGLPSLSFARSEAMEVARTDPTAQLLVGPSATKHSLTAAWQRSSYLFFATHVVDDLDAPYTGFIPMAPDTLRSNIEDEYLEVADVLAADLSSCRLVVLSGCASAAPAVYSTQGGADLAGAFLDAGARTVIRTVWPVRDQEASELMSDFVRRWKLDRQSPEDALHAARRSMMKGPRGPRHPSIWAAYGVDVTESPAEQHASR